MWFVDGVVAKQNEELRKEKDRLSFLANELGLEKATLLRHKHELLSERTTIQQKLEVANESLKRSKDGQFFVKLDLDNAKKEVEELKKRLRESQENVLFWRHRSYKSACDALEATMQANHSIETAVQRSRERQLNAEILKQKTLNASQATQLRLRDGKIRDLERIVEMQRAELERRFHDVKRFEEEMNEILAALACRGINLYEGETYA